MTTVTESAPQTLYRFYDAEDSLLYVGISVRPWQRWKEHRGEKPWWDEVAKVTMENFATRDEVASAELLAIADESPLYNIQGRVVPDAPKEWRHPVADWDGTHVPYSLYRGDLLWCACSEPDWEASESDDWPSGQPTFQPEEYAAHVIEEVLGEHFLTRRSGRVGTAEIQAMLSVSRQRVHQLAESPDFPAPTALLGAGRIWRTADIVKWAEEKGRDVHE